MPGSDATPPSTPSPRPPAPAPTPSPSPSARPTPTEGTTPAEPGPSTDPLDRVLRVQPWPDPLLDDQGHDPRSAYVERFWLPVLGPSTTLLLRRLADGLERQPDGYLLDLRDLGHELGLVSRIQRSPLVRAIERACVFGTAKMLGADTLLVRQRLAPLTRRQAQRLPEHLRDELDGWQRPSPGTPEATPCNPLPADQQRRRARSLALSLLQLGETYEATERQLHRWRFHPALAHEAMRWALAHWSNQATPGEIPDPESGAPEDGPRPVLGMTDPTAA